MWFTELDPVRQAGTLVIARSGERRFWAVIELTRRFMTVQKLVYGSSAALPTLNEAHLMGH